MLVMDGTQIEVEGGNVEIKLLSHVTNVFLSNLRVLNNNLIHII